MGKVRRRWGAVAGLLPLLAGLTGCGRGPAMAEVEGVLRVNGKPQRMIEIQFLPDPEKGASGPVSAAVTDAEGKYRLKTTGDASGKEVAGAAVGWHRVVLTDYSRGMIDLPDKAPPPKVPERYSAPHTTGLHVEVKPGRQSFDIEIKTDAKTVEIRGGGAN